MITTLSTFKYNFCSQFASKSLHSFLVLNKVIQRAISFPGGADRWNITLFLVIDWNNKHHHTKPNDKPETSTTYMPPFSPSTAPSYSPSIAASSTKEEATNVSFPTFGQQA